MNKNYRNKMLSLIMVSVMVLGVFVSVPFNAGAATAVSISFSDGVNSKTVTAGSSVVYSIKVDNNDFSYAQTVNMTLSGVLQYWSGVFSPNANFTLQAGGSTTISLQVYAPSNASAEDKATIVITANYKQGGNSGSVSITSVTLVKQTYGLSTSTTTLSKNIGPGGSSNFDLKITNTGNGIDTVNLSVTTKPSGWSISPPSSQNINPVSFASVAVPCFVPSNTIAGQYSFTVRAVSENPAYTSEMTFIVNVTAVFGVSLQATDTVKYVDPGKTVIFPFNVTNTGNKVDSYDITMNISKSGWYGNPNPNPLSNINPEGVKSFSVILTAPNTANYNDIVTVNVTLKSQGDISKIQKTSIVAIVNKLHNVDLNPAAFNMNVAPGANVMTTVSVTNNGNGEDTIKLLVLNVPIQVMSVTFNQSSLTLAKGASKNVDLTISAVANAQAGNNNIMLKAYASDDPTKEDIQNITVTVTQKYDVLVQANGANTKHANPGGSVSFNLSVKNKGNGKDTFFMSASGAPNDWNFYFNPASINDLDASGVANVVFTVELPKNASPGSKPILVMATSDGGVSVSNSITMTVIADTFYQVEMTAPAPYNATKPNKTATFVVTVRNKGSGLDTFLMIASGQNPSWVSFNKSSVPLAPNAQVNVKVTVSVPTGTAMGNVTQTITATSSGNNTIKASVQITTEVGQEYKVQMTADPAKKAIKPGQSGTIQIYLKNTGNGKDQFYVSLDKNPNLWGNISLSNKYVNMTAGQITTFNLIVIVDKDAKSEDLNYSIKAVSQSDLTIFGTVTAVISINPIYGVDMTGIIISNQAEPTEKVQYQLKVKNTGNRQDTYLLDVLGNYRSWAQLNVGQLTLASITDQRIYINVTVPDQKEPGTYTIEVKVSSKGDDTKTDFINISVEVVQKHDLKLVSASDTLQRADPGVTLTFKVNVTNMGGEKDTVDMSLKSNHGTWTTLSQYQIVDLAKGATKQVTLTVNVPGNARPETFVVKVIGTEESRGRNQTLNLTVVVNQIYAFDLSSPLTEMSVSPGGVVNFTLNIENRGTGADTFMVTALNHTEWVRFNRTSVPLGENKSGPVKMTVTLPSLPLPAQGDHALKIKVESVGDSKVSKTQDFKLTISQVYAVKVTSNVTVAFVDPGNSGKYTLTVENKGNGKDTFVISKSGINPSWISINPISVTLDMGKTTTAQVTVQVPQSATKQILVNTLTVTSQGDTLKNSTVTLTTNVNLVYGVEVTPSSKVKTLNTPTVYTFSMTVKNKGSGNDTFLVEALGEDKEWIKFETTSFKLAPDASKSFNVTLTVPFENPFDELNGTYKWTIKVTSQGYSFQYAALALTVTVDIRYGFSEAWDKTDIAAGPGETVDCNVTINNNGNIQDDYLITATGSYATWAKVNSKSGNSSYTIAALSKDTSRKVPLYITVPLNTPNNKYTIQVDVKSKGNDSILKTTKLTITVSENYAVSLTVDENNLNVGPGATIQFKVKVKNTGNILEDFEMTIDKASGTYYKWAGDPDPGIFNTSKDNYVWVTVNVTPPMDQAKGTYIVRLKAAVTNAKSETSATVDLKVIISFGVEITAISNERSKDVTPGNKMYYNFTIKNKGSGDDTFSLKVDDSIFTDKKIAKWATFTKTEVPVKYDSEVRAMMIITVPIDAEKKDYTFRVKATSTYDENSAAIYDFTLSVLGIAGVTLTTETDVPHTEPSNAVTYTVKLKNTGNQADTYTITAEGSYKSWITFDRSSVSVGYDTTFNLPVTIKVPDDAKVGSYNLTVKAKSTADDTLSGTITLQVFVKQVVDFTVTVDDATKESLPGKNITYTLTIENAGNGDDLYKFEVTSSDSKMSGWATFAADQLVVAYDDKDTIKVYVAIPSDNKDASAGPFNLVIKVISKKNDSIYKQITLTTTITQVYEITLSCSDYSQILDLNGNDAEWDIDVKNTGNGDDTLTFQIDQKESSWQKSWWSFSPSSLDVESDRTRTTTVKLMASRVVDVDSGTFTFRVVSVSSDGDTRSLSLRLEVKVVKAEIQVVSWTIKTTKAKTGDHVPVDITIKNIGSAATPSTVSIAILLDNNPVATTTTSKLNAGEDTTLTMNWEPTEAVSGTMKVRVTVAGDKYDSSAKTVEATGGVGLAGLDMSSPMFMIVLLLIVVIIVIVVIMAATKKKPIPSPMMPPPPMEEGAGEEEQEQGGEEGAGEEESGEDGAGEEEAPSEEEAPTPRVAKIRCPKCKEIMEISSPKRPLEVRCSSCNAKLLLKK